LGKKFQWDEADADLLSTLYDVGGIFGGIFGGLFSVRIRFENQNLVFL